MNNFSNNEKMNNNSNVLTQFKLYADFGSGFRYIGIVDAYSLEDAMQKGKETYSDEIKLSLKLRVFFKLK